MSPQRLSSSWQGINERLRHQQGLAQNLIELSDAARQVDVRADHREVQPRARAHVAIGCFSVMQGDARCDNGRKPARAVRSLELVQGLDGGGEGRLRSTSSISSSVLRRSSALWPISPSNQWKRPATRAWVISR